MTHKQPNRRSDSTQRDRMCKQRYTTQFVGTIRGRTDVHTGCHDLTHERDVRCHQPDLLISFLQRYRTRESARCASSPLASAFICTISSLIVRFVLGFSPYHFNSPTDLFLLTTTGAGESLPLGGGCTRHQLQGRPELSRRIRLKSTVESRSRSAHYCSNSGHECQLRTYILQLAGNALPVMEQTVGGIFTEQRAVP
jgi:hypothetical protein